MFARGRLANMQRCDVVHRRMWSRWEEAHAQRKPIIWELDELRGPHEQRAYLPARAHGDHRWERQNIDA